MYLQFEKAWLLMGSFRFKQALEIFEDLSIHILDIKNINL
jgi:hypothetical protein